MWLIKCVRIPIPCGSLSEPHGMEILTLNEPHGMGILTHLMSHMEWKS